MPEAHPLHPGACRGDLLEVGDALGGLEDRVDQQRAIELRLRLVDLLLGVLGRPSRLPERHPQPDEHAPRQQRDADDEAGPADGLRLGDGE